jgi:hypothetical protein
MQTTLEGTTCTGEQRYVLDTGMGVVSGTPDHYNPDTGIIQDYKYTSVYSFQSQGSIVKWTEQLNLYAHILRSNNLPVNGLEIVCILRDWQPNKVGREAGYPEVWCHVIPISLWEDDDAFSFLSKRLGIHHNSSHAECTSEEMWEKPGTWAVIRDGQKRAVRVFTSEDDAHVFINDYKYPECMKLDVQYRPGERTRCERWCNVRDFCPQYSEYKKTKEV